MRVIWKATKLAYGKHDVQLPDGARFAHFAVQLGKDWTTPWSAWFVCDPKAPLITVTLRIVATGEEWDEDQWEYLGTLQQGHYVWHLLREYD